jgi:hypothetical protein
LAAFSWKQMLVEDDSRFDDALSTPRSDSIL